MLVLKSLQWLLILLLKRKMRFNALWRPWTPGSWSIWAETGAANAPTKRQRARTTSGANERSKVSTNHQVKPRGRKTMPQMEATTYNEGLPVPPTPPTPSTQSCRPKVRYNRPSTDVTVNLSTELMCATYHSFATSRSAPPIVSSWYGSPRHCRKGLDTPQNAPIKGWGAAVSTESLCGRRNGMSRMLTRIFAHFIWGSLWAAQYLHTTTSDLFKTLQNNLQEQWLYFVLKIPACHVCRGVASCKKC